MIEADLAQRLNAQAGLAALLGERIFPFATPDETPLPYLTFRRDSTDPDDTLDDAKSVHRVVFIFETHAQSYQAALQIAAQVKAALDGWRSGDPDFAIMAMSFAGEHDGAGEFDEAARRRRTFCREQVFVGLFRA